MSRFKQPDRALAPLPAAQLGKAARSATLLADEPSLAPAATAPKTTVTPRAKPPAESIASKIGMVALCGLILSPYIQDLTLRLGFKPYLNKVCLIILPLAFLASGRVFRPLQNGIGKAWLGFAVFATLAIPFSYWPGDSFRVVWDFFTQNLSIFAYICAFAISYRQCRWIVNANIIGAVLVLVSCVVFGDYLKGGRLYLPGSFFLFNSNDLAMHLLIDLGFFYYLAIRPGKIGRVVGGTGILITLYFLLKTGSRGGFLALGVFLLVLFLFSGNKIRWAAVALPAIALSLALMPSGLLHRFTLILWDPDASQAQNSDLGAIESQQERQDLMKKALHYTFARPLTGVGPGEFMNAVWTDEHKDGKHPQALGTHNTYLEVSSECGLPAFFFYTAVVLGCIVMNYKVFRSLRKRPDLADAVRLTYCLLAISAGFAVSIFFHHLTYALYLPILSGLTVCVRTAALALKPGVASPV